MLAELLPISCAHVATTQSSTPAHRRALLGSCKSAVSSADETNEMSITSGFFVLEHLAGVALPLL